MQYAMREKIISHLAKVDALYYAIGITITILELALIATNKKFGAASLELSFLIQIILSVIVESFAGVLFLSRSPYFATIYGMLFKTLAVLLLGAAVISSTVYTLTFTWICLLIFFMLDGIGSGCLLSAFRPAYAQWYARKMGYKEQADFLKIFRKKLLIRLGLPLVILLFSVLFFYVTQVSNILHDRYYFYSSIIIIGTMLVARLYQLKITTADFKGLSDFKSDKTSNYIDKLTFKFFMKSIIKIKNNIFIYIVGDVAFLTIMMYAIGLGFKLTTKISIPFYLAWLGGSLIGFIIYLVSNLVGYFVYPKFSETFHNTKTALAILILSASSLLCIIGFNTTIINFQISALLAFSLVAVVVGNGLLRLTANHIIREVPVSLQQAVFILGEASASFIIALAVIISLYFKNYNATIMTLCAFILLLGIFSMAMLLCQPFYKQNVQCENKNNLKVI